MTLLPRRLLFDNPDRAFALISPDGRYIASLAPVEGVMNIVIAPIAEPAAGRPLTRESGRGIGHCVWAQDSQSLLFLADRDGDEQWHLYQAGIDGGQHRDLTPGDALRARLLELTPRYPDAVLVEIQSSSPEQAGLFRIELTTAERRAVTDVPPFQHLLTDDFVPVLGARPRADGGTDWYQPGDPDWVAAFSVPPEDALTTWPVGLGNDGWLYLVDSRDRDTAALCALRLKDGLQRLLFEDKSADVTDVLFDARGRMPLAVAVTRERKHWHALDAGIAAEFDYLRGRCHGDISLASRTPDDRHWIIGYQSDTAPVRFYHYDRRAGDCHYLFSNSRRLESLPLLSMRTAAFAAADGLPLTAYYTCPDQSGGPYPMVLLVHGGPWARDEWGFQPWHQWLASRGYAVLSVNYRGSTGFGKVFLNAGDREWGGAMQKDLLDAVDWAIGQGITESDHIGIMGTSYGGYATLAGLAFTPTRYACGIDLMGPSHLVSLLQAIPPQWQSQQELFRRRVGDPASETDRRMLESRSPLFRAGQIQRPLLILQGEKDPRVPRAESDRIVSALIERGVPVIYLLFPDEGHGLARPVNRLVFCAIAEAFLARHLGGLAEPPGDELQASNVQILAGADYLPEWAVKLGKGRNA